MRRWRTSVRLNRVEYLQRTVVGVLRTGSMPFRCAAGRAMAVLEPNGDVKLCETTGPVGNLRDAAFDFRAIWRSAAARDMRKRLTRCGCTHPCFLSTSSKLDLRALAESTLLVRR
jgi:MoaA/NifB/PqqE/SkfB family radical SAM enzyme